MISSRRGFLFGVGASVIAAPAIVRAASLMPVRAIDVGLLNQPASILAGSMTYIARTSLPAASWRMVNEGWPTLSYNKSIDEMLTA